MADRMDVLLEHHLAALRACWCPPDEWGSLSRVLRWAGYSAVPRAFPTADLMADRKEDSKAVSRAAQKARGMAALLASWKAAPKAAQTVDQ